MKISLRSGSVTTAAERGFSDFPQPVAELRGTLIWSWPDVEAWAKATGRLP